MSENASVGLVLISHSRALAEGAADVAAQVGGDAGRIVGIGGTEDGRLGTSLDALVTAVEKVAGEAGTVIIPDLGSSVLTARAYLAEDAGRHGAVVVADAPFVEGAVAAAVAAAAGAGLDEVVAAAEGARDVRKT
ncbi:MAG: phosphoenolpyruvate---glycerone phosphotransferase subunit DhaM [Actinomycetota bacterium]|jgi:dihydroxyacetone kinase DhaKLM complex PTS-EIIA-like component DhaM|nr:phosphoenolpyruvate---glycerone phosphotransferase subunit DhaM [Actinomycetota bacterium]